MLCAGGMRTLRVRPLWLWYENKHHPRGMAFVFMAQEEGFEPPCLLGKRFSRPPRCDRFDIPAYHNARCRIMISRESLCGSEKFIFQNPLRIPHADASSSLVSGKWGYLRQSRNVPITMQNCAIIQVLSCAWCALLSIAFNKAAYNDNTSWVDCQYKYLDFLKNL